MRFAPGRFFGKGAAFRAKEAGDIDGGVGKLAGFCEAFASKARICFGEHPKEGKFWKIARLSMHKRNV